MKGRQYLLLVVLTIISVIFVSCGENYSEEIDQLNAEVARLQDEIATNAGNVKELQDEIEELQITGTENATAISANAANIEQIHADLNDVQGRIDALDGFYNAGILDEIWNSIVAIQAELDAIKADAITGKDGAPMVLIPASEFEMGTDSSEVPQLFQWSKKWYSSPQSSWFENEAPRHTVYLDAFYMDMYEVTNALYKKFIDATGHKTPMSWNDSRDNAPDQPVVGVSWDDAKAYADWAGKRLPTEAEWEKAARGGLVRKRFPWGDSDPDGSQCNFADNRYWGHSDKSVKDGYRYTAPVGSFSPNGYGLYDMAGNVWEWCADWYDEKYYANSPGSKPTGPGSGTSRVLRGGSWWNAPDDLRAAARGWYYYDQSSFSRNGGFRCVSQD